MGDKTANIRVMTRADAIVGQYGLFVETVAKDEENVFHCRYKHEDDIFLLFNPWAPGNKWNKLPICLISILNFDTKCGKYAQCTIQSIFSLFEDKVFSDDVKSLNL